MEFAQYRARCEEIGGRAYSLLPTMDMVGHTTVAGHLVYGPDWRDTGNLLEALLEYACARNANDRASVRQDIVDVIYGGDDAYSEYTKALMASIRI